MGNTKATLAQVARAAGVSSATASRVIHATGPVSDTIRARIEAAIAELGYEPRKSLAAARPHEGAIAVLAGDLLNPYFPEVIRGIQDEVDNYGMVLTLYNVTDHPQRQNLLVEKLSRQKVDGIVLMGSRPFPALVEWQQKQRLPMVLINRGASLPYVHCIMVDFENALYRATQHLLSLNHVRIGYVSAFVNSDIAIARRRGIELALNEARLALLPEYCASVPPGTEVDGGFQAMNALLDRPVEDCPTAILAFNDVVALGALHALRLRGLRVPQDISVIGVDDIYSSVYTSPPLTTIGQPKFRMGVLAVQRLQMMNQQAWSNDSTCTILDSPLIVRESTGPAPRG
jgi:DNA-binding LacI/PurR family transcriptional regulator